MRFFSDMPPGQDQWVMQRVFANRTTPGYFVDAGADPVTVSRVKTTRLDTLLDEVRAPVLVDYMSIDVEGNELEALSSFPFDRRCVLALTVENYYIIDGTRQPAHHRSAVHSLLVSKGMQLVRTAGADDFYLHPSVVRADLIEVRSTS